MTNKFLTLDEIVKGFQEVCDKALNEIHPDDPVKQAELKVKAFDALCEGKWGFSLKTGDSNEPPETEESK